MHKNPFAVPPSYPQQPPLPPGPPPPQPAQPDYSAYWAAAAAAQPGAYNAQWSAAQAQNAPRPTPEQSALYANYGYGPGQQNWQQQQLQRQPQHYQPPPPVAQPPPPPPPPAQTYNPYQPQTVAYQQPYIPQAAPHPAPYQPPVVQAPPQYQQPQQQYFPQQQQQQQQLQQQNRQQRPQQSQHLPPAKRQRFGPTQSQGQIQPPPPTQPAHSAAIGGGVGVGVGAFPQGPAAGRGGGPGANQIPLGNNRGGFMGGRGGNVSGRGRGQMNMNKGGNRGRGGFSNMGYRGPNQGGNFRGHGRGFGNRDNRRGGSFSAGIHGQQQQQQQQQHGQGFPGGSGSFNRGRFHHPGRKQDAAIPHGPKDVSASASVSVGKKEENRRTLTDFKIIGLELRELGWNWGVIPSTSDADVKEEHTEVDVPKADTAGEEGSEQKPDVSVTSETETQPAEPSAETTVATEKDIVVKTDVTTASMPPPPSRIRIYFHTPVSADDVHSLTPQSSLVIPSDSSVRKGKRKKLDDDDGDLEDGRGAPPPPPGMDHDLSTAPNVEHDGTRGSVAPSVAETVSEGDWLMAAIGTEDAEAGDVSHSQATELEESHDDDADAIGEEYVEGDGYEIHEDVTMGSIDEHSVHFEHGPNGPPEGVLLTPGPNDVPPPSTDANAVTDSIESESVETMLKTETPSGPSEIPDSSPSVHDSHDASTGTVEATATAESEVTATVSDLPRTQPEGKNADSDDLPQSQITCQLVKPHPLQATDSIATIPDINSQQDVSPYASTVLEEASQAEETSEEVTTQVANHTATADVQQPQGDLGTPSTSTAVSGVEDISVSQVPKSDAKMPSANRLSISYAAGTRRMVIDAEVVERLRVFRSEGRIEVLLNVSKDDGSFNGIMVEAFSDASSSYTPLDITDSNLNDATIPPFNTASLPLKITLIAYLDKERPLSEPKWVKTGDIQDWLRNMFGRMFWVAGDAADAWEKKIEVADPDPPPTIWTLLEAWAANSNTGSPNERQRFLRTHMTETDNILEILLRLVRGERASFSQSSVLNANNVSGPLLSALSQGSAHAAQQTHVSLAVLAIFRLAVEYAKKAVGGEGKNEVEEKVGEIIRCLPSHLIYKSLEGIFKEWRVEKKGGR